MNSEKEIIREAFQIFCKDPFIYRPEHIDIVMKRVRKYFRFSYYQDLKYFNVPAAFDIETSSFIYNGEKMAVMWSWSLGIFGLTIQGRKWEEFTRCLDFLESELKLNLKKRFMIYVHNLSYEFGFMRKWIQWEKVFSVKPRTPVYALTTGGIEFRCSYILTGYSLEKVGEHLTDFPVKKLVGTIDYSLLRTSDTPRSPEEIIYLKNDVLVVMCHIMEEIDRNGGIALIPLTKTGYVRRTARNNCFYVPGQPKAKSVKRLRYRDTIKELTLDPLEYKDMKDAFQGGFTHSNPFFHGKTITEKVVSADISSSYPTVMFEKYPMGPGEVLEDLTETDDIFSTSVECYCCIMVVTITGLEPAILHEHYLSESRCRDKVGTVIDNGRVVFADSFTTTITDIDYKILKHCYTWDSFHVVLLRRYVRGYLPKDFLLTILQLYEDKTTLKGVDGMESEYMNAKEQVNSCYGMTVTDTIGKPEIEYYPDTQEWADIEFTVPLPVITENCMKYNKDPNRFLFYGWGVFVTAYARRNLWTAILELGEDYIYSDTDSVKFRNPENHRTFFIEYNRKITERIKRTCDDVGLPFKSTRPRTIKGVEKPLGVFEVDGIYRRFKTLGAKRYMVEYEDGSRSLTVSGLNKSLAMPYIESLGDPFEYFNEDLDVPENCTGKLTHTYIDGEIVGTVTDYLGMLRRFHERSAVHLAPAAYSLSISQEYRDFISTISIMGGLYEIL